MPRWLSATVMATVVACGSAAPPALASGSHRLPPIPAGERIAVVIGLPSAGPAAATPPAPSSAQQADKRQRFWVHDKHRYTSPWYLGARRKMVAFGCTRAPYYDPDPRCTKQHGFHHGLDLAMPCGTPLYAAYRTRVVDPESAGSLGSAYGSWAFRLRSGRFHKDFVIGHVRRVFVDPGDVVTRG
jgi:murein DD-endopeptidase MepM/ murein hydrolase activator NlpD